MVGTATTTPSSVMTDPRAMARFQSAKVAIIQPVNAEATIPATFPDVFIIEENTPACPGAISTDNAQ